MSTVGKRILLLAVLVCFLCPGVLSAAFVYKPGGYELGGGGTWTEYFPAGEGQAGTGNLLSASGFPWVLVASVKTNGVVIGDPDDPDDGYDFKTLYNVVLAYVGPGDWGSAITLNNVEAVNLSKRASYEEPDESLALWFKTSGIVAGSNGIDYRVVLELLFDSNDSDYEYRPDGYPSHTVEFSEGLTLSISQVPVPGAVWLLGSGLVGLVAVRRRRS